MERAHSNLARYVSESAHIVNELPSVVRVGNGRSPRLGTAMSALRMWTPVFCRAAASKNGCELGALRYHTPPIMGCLRRRAASQRHRGPEPGVSRETRQASGGARC